MGMPYPFLLAITQHGNGGAKKGKYNTDERRINALNSRFVTCDMSQTYFSTVLSFCPQQDEVFSKHIITKVSEN